MINSKICCIRKNIIETRFYFVNIIKKLFQTTLREAQGIAEAVLDAEVRIGELTAAMPKASGGDRRSEDFKSNNADTFETLKPKEEQLADIGSTRQQAQRFETHLLLKQCNVKTALGLLRRAVFFYKCG